MGKQEKREGKRRINILLLLLCLLFLGAAVFSGYKIISTLLEYREGEQVYEEMRQYVQLPTAPPSQAERPDSTEPPLETEPVVTPVDFEALWDINPDVVGWIYIEGTNINYPILQGETNETYLYHLVNGSYNRSGSIFMDFRNERDFTDQNTVIYGHHMRDGSMFADLVNFKSQSFYDAHPTGYLFTPERTYTLTFFTGYISDISGDAWRTDFSSDEDFAQWLQNSVSRSMFSSSISPSHTDRILTFSTCTYEYDDARFILAAIME